MIDLEKLTKQKFDYKDGWVLRNWYKNKDDHNMIHRVVPNLELPMFVAEEIAINSEIEKLAFAIKLIKNLRDREIAIRKMNGLGATSVEYAFRVSIRDLKKKLNELKKMRDAHE